MIVLFNSDVMHAEYLIADSLPSHLNAFLLACAQNDVTVMIPETTLHEFQRQQESLVPEERKKLSNSYATLSKRGISFERKDPNDVVAARDLMTLIEKTGVSAHVVRPTIEDFQGAHLRACRHQPPIAPDAKSDEMRDVIIWMISLRVAQEHGGALLLSRDRVHTHRLGDEEADIHGLVRFRDVDEALEFLGTQSPVGSKIREMLEIVWAHVIAEGFPVTKLPAQFSVVEAKLRQGTHGLDRAEAKIKLRTEGTGALTFRFTAFFQDGAIRRVDITDYSPERGSADVQPISVKVAPKDSLLVEHQSDYDARLSAIRHVIGENQ